MVMSDLCLQRHWEESEPVAKISGKTSGRRGRERSFWPGLLAASPRHGNSADVAEAQLQPVPEIIPGFPSQGKKSSVGQPSYSLKFERGKQGKKQEGIAGELQCLHQYVSPMGSCAGVWWQPVEVGWFQRQSVAGLCWNKWLGWEDVVVNLWFVWVTEWQTVIKNYSSKSVWSPKWFATALLSLKHCFVFPKSPLKSGMSSEVAFS